jgi:hypothetical protein
MVQKKLIVGDIVINDFRNFTFYSQILNPQKLL